jgi:hypothetical protein
MQTNNPNLSLPPAGLRFPMHEYEVRRRKDHRVDLISDALPFGRLWYIKVADAIDYAKDRSRSHHAVIRAYDEAGNVIETHKHKGEFKEPWVIVRHFGCLSRRCLLQNVDGPESFVCGARFDYFDFTDKTKKRGRPRIHTAAYWREYYRLKQREWRAAHPRPKTRRREKQRGK